MQESKGPEGPSEPAVRASPDAIRARARQEARNILHLYLDIAWQGLIAAGISTYLAVYLVRLGASALLIGLLTSLPALVTILFSIPSAYFLAGRRDLISVVNWSRLGARLSYLAIAAVPYLLTGDRLSLAPVVVVGIWSLSAVFSSVTTPAWTSVYAAAVPPRRRPQINGGRWALFSLITAVAVSLFGRLLDVVPSPTNYQLIFVLSFIAGLFSIYHFGQLHLPEASGPSSLPPSPWRTLAASGVLKRYLVGTFVYRLGISLPAALYPLYWVGTLGASDTLIGLRTTAGYGALVVAYFIWGRIAVRYGHRRVLLASSLGLAIYPALTALARTPAALVPIALVWGAFAAGIDHSFFESLLQAAPAEERASAAALDATVANVAVCVGPLVGTTLAGLVGFPLAFVASGGLCVAGTGLFWVLRVGHRQPQPPAEPGAAGRRTVSIGG